MSGKPRLGELRSAFEDPQISRGLIDRIHEAAAALPRPVTLMEVCGSHTHAIAAAGLRSLMPGSVRLVSGPGCPICVTPISYVDHGEALARRLGTVVSTFGDLLRVPSSRGSLEQAQASGADVQTVYSPRDALALARAHPELRVIFLAVGFETTAPTIAAALAEAEQSGIANFLILPGHKLIPPPLAVLADDPEVQLDGLICPGHVSVIIGAKAFDTLAERNGLPCAVAGFASNDVLRGVLDLVQQIVDGRSVVSNLYARVVRPEGNSRALEMIDRFFVPADARWRGLGPIPMSGLVLRPEYAHRDASLIAVELPTPEEPAGCRCGEVLRAQIDPPECALFGTTCTPATAVGACMVSGEGTCAAWYRHERLTRSGAPV